MRQKFRRRTRSPSVSGPYPYRADVSTAAAGFRDWSDRADHCTGTDVRVPWASVAKQLWRGGARRRRRERGVPFLLRCDSLAPGLGDMDSGQVVNWWRGPPMPELWPLANAASNRAPDTRHLEKWADDAALPPAPGETETRREKQAWTACYDTKIYWHGPELHLFIYSILYSILSLRASGNWKIFRYYFGIKIVSSPSISFPT